MLHGRLRSKLNVGTLNVRGLNTDLQKIQLANDMQKYQLSVLAIQETKLKSEGIFEITSSDSMSYDEVYHTGNEENKHHGVGIVIEKGIYAEFSVISNRICKIITKIGTKENQKKLTFISSYAPTLEVSKKNPKIKEDYYEELENIIKM
eukprot:Seg1.8 transcript_id=Seg1.8/GoldUCD/mRNA.D3Y31 product="hypothetical protein" protein_id=Seg1.8/GoldUCD/D3Y31